MLDKLGEGGYVIVAIAIEKDFTCNYANPPPPPPIMDSPFFQLFGISDEIKA